MNILPQLFRTLEFVAVKHSDQRRKGASDTPYVNHLIEVAYLLADVAEVIDSDILIAGLLHDCVEDTDTSLDEVESLFGLTVRELVAALSDDKTLSKAERKRLVLEHLVSATDAVKLIKLADLCSNIKSVPMDWTSERTREYLDWARRAASLCFGINPALDDVFLFRWREAQEKQ